MALFGQTVIAELSTNVRKLSPNETRSVEACFLHPGLDTGPIVQGLVRVENELVLKRFVARNIRAVLPPEWDLRFGASVFSKMEQEIEDVALPDGAEPPRRRLRPLPEVVEEDVSKPPEDDLVEYPDGASGELVRQMKEPDVPLPKKRSAATGSSQGGLKLARPVEPEPSGVPRVVVGGETSAVPSRDQSRVFPPTSRCPACQSGMVAPGIRHSAECRRLRYAFDHPDSPEPLQTDPVVPTQVPAA